MADHLWIVCSTLRFLLVAELFAQLWDFYWWLNCLLNFASFFYSGLKFYSWPQWFGSPSEHGSHLWIVCSTLWFSLVAELFAQLWDFCWWLNCLLNFASFFYSGLKFYSWPQWFVSPSESMGRTCELLAQLCDSHWWLNCLPNFEIFVDGWIVCSTLRFLLVAELFAQLCEFFYSGLKFYSWPQWFGSPSESMGHTCELLAQLWDFYWWLNCLLNFASFFILASMICVPIREHGSHLWVVCSTLRVFLISDLSFEIKFVNLKVGQTCPKPSKPVHKTPLCEFF